MKPADVKWNTYIDSSKEINSKDPEFKICDTVRISQYKIIFGKGYTLNWSKRFLWLKKFKKTVPSTYVTNDINREEIAGTFYKKELQKIKHKEFKIEKVIKRKDQKLYVKCKGYNNLFNS